MQPLPFLLLSLLFISCGFDRALDRFGDQLLEQMDSEPPKLVEVRNDVSAPEGMPSSEELDAPAYPIDAPPPDYPGRLRKKGVEGKATVFFIVDSAGTLRNPQITHATDTSFAQALLDAVTTWKVAPGKKDGKPVSCHTKITIDFELH